MEQDCQAYMLRRIASEISTKLFICDSAREMDNYVESIKNMLDLVSNLKNLSHTEYMTILSQIDSLVTIFEKPEVTSIIHKNLFHNTIAFFGNEHLILNQIFDCINQMLKIEDNSEDNIQPIELIYNDKVEEVYETPNLNLDIETTNQSLSEVELCKWSHELNEYDMVDQSTESSIRQCIEHLATTIQQDLFGRADGIKAEAYVYLIANAISKAVPNLTKEQFDKIMKSDEYIQTIETTFKNKAHYTWSYPITKKISLFKEDINDQLIEDIQKTIFPIIGLSTETTEL